MTQRRHLARCRRWPHADGAMTAVRENGAASGIGVLATYAYDNLGRRTQLTRGNGAKIFGSTWKSPGIVISLDETLRQFGCDYGNTATEYSLLFGSFNGRNWGPTYLREHDWRLGFYVMTKRQNDDDALALSKAIEEGLRQEKLARIEFIVDVLNRNDETIAVSRLQASGYECDVWDDPVDKTLSIYAARMLFPTLEAILGEKEEIRRILFGLNVVVDDWGTAIPRGGN